MKVILLDNRIFQDKKDLLDFLTSELNRGFDISKYEIKVATLNISSESNGSEFLNSQVIEISREVKINSITSFDFDLVGKFKDQFIKFATENKSKGAILNKLNLISDLESLSKFVKNNSNYFLYQVSNSTDWLVCLLSVYNFRSIKEEFIKEYIDINTNMSKFGLRTTPDELKKNFLEAKSIIKNAKVN